MNIAVLGDGSSAIAPFLMAEGHAVVVSRDPIEESFILERNISFVVSYRYHHIIRPTVLRHIPGRVVNLHISLLPWNRGADPNLWSFLEDSPKGVTIHHIDAGIDTGDIIIQEEVHFHEAGETLATTYRALNDRVVRLFELNWDRMARMELPRIPQRGTGSFHRVRDKEPYKHLLDELGWDTPVSRLKGKALPAQARHGGGSPTRQPPFPTNMAS